MSEALCFSYCALGRPSFFFKKLAFTLDEGIFNKEAVVLKGGA